MKKFLLITVGFEQPSPEVMEQWKSWFQSIGDNIVEQVGLMPGTKVTEDSITELGFAEDALTGYLVINSESKESAIKIAKKCPMVTSTLVYEIRE